MRSYFYVNHDFLTKEQKNPLRLSRVAGVKKTDEEITVLLFLYTE